MNQNEKTTGPRWIEVESVDRPLSKGMWGYRDPSLPTRFIVVDDDVPGVVKLVPFEGQGEDKR